MAMFLKPTIDCIFLDKVLVMILARSSNTKLPRIVAGMPRPSEATICVAKSIADCIARCRCSTKISWASISSSRSESRPVTSLILLRHFWMAATFAKTTSLSGINSSFQDAVLAVFPYPLQIVILIDRVGKELVEILFVNRIEQGPILENLHFHNRRGEIQDNKVGFSLED